MAKALSKSLVEPARTVAATARQDEETVEVRTYPHRFVRVCFIDGACTSSSAGKRLWVPHERTRFFFSQVKDVS